MPLIQNDSLLAASLQRQMQMQSHRSASPPDGSHLPASLTIPHFRPDLVLSLNDNIALYDSTYTKYPNVFRLLQTNGRQILFQAFDESDLNAWMAVINYSASFRTAGIRMRDVNRNDSTYNGNSSLEMGARMGKQAVAQTLPMMRKGHAVPSLQRQGSRSDVVRVSVLQEASNI